LIPKTGVDPLVPAYRCYFLNSEAAVAGAPAIVDAASDAEALQRAAALYAEQGDRFSGYELWQGPRHVHTEARSERA
jgi:hypothetical protein